MNTKSSKGAETKGRIIEAAIELFHREGLYATSPDDVIEASGTGKGQFYYYFKNKKDLVHTVLQLHLEVIREGGGPINHDIDSWSTLERWFQMHAELQRHFNMTRGCFFGTIGSELTTDDELIRQDLNLIFEVIKNKLSQFFSIEKTKGHLKESARPVEMADFCVAAVQGAMLIGKLKRDSNAVQIVLREAFIHMRSYISIVADGGFHDAAENKVAWY